MSGNVTPTRTVFASGDDIIDGILTKAAWSGGYIEYSFPSVNTSYSYSYYDNHMPANMFQMNLAQQTAVHFALNADIGPSASVGFSVEGFTGLTITQDTTPDSGDTIRIANTTSTSVGTARVADFPGNQTTTNMDDNGDVWFGPYGSGIYLTPEAGNFAWHTHLHELGHALGLSHGQSTWEMGVKLPTQYDAMEYSVMTYRSYVGDPLSGGYSNETWGYAQTYMMADIAALQYMYGADFTTNSGDTVYKWDPSSGDTLVNGAVAIDAGGNRIFATIWDGGGTDTYDLSAYTTDLQIDLSPGGSSLFSSVQQANLGDGNFAKGNIYNALLYQGDTRSLIENAIGGSGNDSIFGNDTFNTLRGGAGNDSLNGQAAADVLHGDAGHDSLTGGTGADTLWGGDGDDTIFGNTSTDVLYGEGGNDSLSGGDGVDEMHGGSGNDYLIGRNGWDSLYGDAGNDTLLGSSGDDLLRGGSGNDSLSGGSAVDLLYGDAGNDTLYGNFGADSLWGGTDNDELYGGSGWDTLRGEAGDDILYGNEGDDLLDGGADDDELFGGTGDDDLRGGSGNDTLWGGQGPDTFDGGTGDDALHGGTHADTFVFSDGDGVDTIHDFSTDEDILRLDDAIWGGGLTEQQVLDIYGGVSGGNYVLDFQDGQIITLIGVTDEALLVDDLAFF